jgi:hypothetical protein
MKRNIIIALLLILVSCALTSQETISLLNDSITFNKIDSPDVIYTNNWKGSWRGKIRITTNILDNEYVRTAEANAFSPEFLKMYKTNNKINSQELMKLLERNQPFLLTKYDETFLKESYSLIYYKDKIVGESYFSTNTTEISWPSGFGYKIIIVGDNTLFVIYLTWVDSDAIIPKSFPDYFIEVNGEYYWKNENIIHQLYQQLSSNEYQKLPEPLKILRETYDLILNSVEIK